MKVQATAKFVDTTTRKLQLAAGLVRGRKADEAVVLLNAAPQRAAATLAKVVNSAVANAVNNHNLKKANLVVDQVLIGPGPTQKRFRPRSRGMAAPIRRRSSHITVIVGEQALPKPTAPVKPKATKSAAKQPAKQPVTKKEAK
jgi:large subunit ribosomal protein L22